MTTLLDNSDVTIPEVTDVKFEDLVGEGKKFKDTEAIAKKIVHSDAHIARLEKEAERLRETVAMTQAKLEANDRLASIEDLLKNPPEPKSLSNDGNPPREPDRTAPLDETKIEQILDAREMKRRKDANILEVKKKLVSEFGNAYPEKVKAVASELGVGVNFLDSIAADNPTAFFKLVGLDKPQVRQEQEADYVPPRSRVTFDTPRDSSEKNWKYYEAMRRSDPVKYSSVATQWEMEQSAFKYAEQGRPEDFYK